MVRSRLVERDATVKLDLLSLPVSDWRRSRDWWVAAFGFEVEFALPDGGAVGLGVTAHQDEAGPERPGHLRPSGG